MTSTRPGDELYRRLADPIDLTWGQLHNGEVTDPALWLAAIVAVGFLAAAGLPAVPAAVGAVRARCRPLRSSRGLRAVVVIVALLAVSRSRPGSAEVPPPMVRLERSAAAPPSTRPEPISATSYEVQKGDSLWRIARRSLIADSGKEPSSAEIDRFWRRIYEANRKLVGADPDLIHPGQRLQIPRR